MTDLSAAAHNLDRDGVIHVLLRAHATLRRDGAEARAMAGYLRRDYSERGADQPIAPRASPIVLRDRVAARLPTLEAEVAPIAWARRADTARFAA